MIPYIPFPFILWFDSCLGIFIHIQSIGWKQVAKDTDLYPSLYFCTFAYTLSCTLLWCWCLLYFHLFTYSQVAPQSYSAICAVRLGLGLNKKDKDTLNSWQFSMPNIHHHLTAEAIFRQISPRMFYNLYKRSRLTRREHIPHLHIPRCSNLHILPKFTQMPSGYRYLSRQIEGTVYILYYFRAFEQQHQHLALELDRQLGGLHFSAVYLCVFYRYAVGKCTYLFLYRAFYYRNLHKLP